MGLDQANLLIGIANLLMIVAGLVILIRRASWFGQFMDLLNSIDEQHAQTQAIREDWERRGEGRIPDPE